MKGRIYNKIDFGPISHKLIEENLKTFKGYKKV